MMKKRDGFQFLAVALGLMLAVSSRAAEKSAGSAAEKPTGNFEITVSLEGEDSFKQCLVYVYDQMVELDNDRPTVVVSEIPVGNYAVTADATTGGGLFKKVVRYVGVQLSWVDADKTTAVNLVLKPIENINDFCLQCHPDPGQKIEPGQIGRDAHSSGQILGDKYIDQVKEYNKTIERLEKEGKPHGFPIKLEKRIVNLGGKKVERLFYTCESCHTFHLKTAYTSYAVAAFREASNLCDGCHY